MKKVHNFVIFLNEEGHSFRPASARNPGY